MRVLPTPQFPTAKECANLNNDAFVVTYEGKYGEMLMGQTYAKAAPKSSIVIGMMATAISAIPAGLAMLAHDIIANPAGSMLESPTGLVIGGVTLGVCAIMLGKECFKQRQYDNQNNDYYINEVAAMDKIAKSRPELADLLTARRATKQQEHQQELSRNGGSSLGPVAAGFIIGSGGPG